MSTKTNFVNGLPELLVLRLLAKNEMYGYQLVREIAARSRNAFNFGEGCIYPILHRMVKNGFVSERRDLVAGRERVYYKASAKGRKQTQKLMQEWGNVVLGAQSVMEVRRA